jgi:hypothetical protein
MSMTDGSKIGPLEYILNISHAKRPELPCPGLLTSLFIKEVNAPNGAERKEPTEADSIRCQTDFLADFRLDRLYH